MSRKKEAYNFFIERGYSPEVSAGIVGNLIHESGLNTGIEGDKGLKGGSSYGLAQWREGRLNGLKEFAKGKNTSWTDFKTQLAFVDHELNTTEKGTLKRLMRTRSPEEASDVFMRGYERPSKKAIIDSGGSRAKNARELFGGTYKEISNTDNPITEGYTSQEAYSNYKPSDYLDFTGDSSHIRDVEVPYTEDKVLEAKKDILRDEISNMTETQQVVPTLPESIEESVRPTYEYLTNTNLFQLG